MGWELFRYLKYLNASVISIENVPEFKKWSPLDDHGNPDKTKVGFEFERWKRAIMDLGYEYKESIRNAADDGLPTRRVRFFCFFYKPGIEITFPPFTHSASGKNGTHKHKSCRPHIDTDDHGISIFGRQFNESLRKCQRKPLCNNSILRIVGGIKKLHPAFFQFLAKYHAGKNPERFQSLDLPINTIDTSNRHQLITIEKLQFIADHCHTDNFNLLSEPINPILTRQTKTIVTADVFVTQYYGGSMQFNSLDDPINTIPCRDMHQLVRLEKSQFIAKYFNNFGNPALSIQTLDEPLSTVLTTNKHQLITLLDGFDIKARFLRPDELAACSTFPKNYFNPQRFKLSHKDAVRLIGNAVPPMWAERLMAPNITSMKDYKLNRLSA
jgi:DNA (cytosine-5)-methyltransferase 1